MRRHAREYGVVVVLLAALLPLGIVLVVREIQDDSPKAQASLPGAAGTVAAAAVPFTQTDSGAGGVTVEVTWLTEADLAAGDLAANDLTNEIAFRVTIDTELLDLMAYDLTSISLLRDGEKREFTPRAWRPIEESSQHREGVLIFQRPPTTGGVELIILGLGGQAQRVFRWETVPTG